MIKVANFGLGSAILMLLWAIIFFIRMLGKADIVTLANLFITAAVLVVLIYFMYKRCIWPYAVIFIITIARVLYENYQMNTASTFLVFNAILQGVGLIGIIVYKIRKRSQVSGISETEIVKDNLIDG